MSSVGREAPASPGSEPGETLISVTGLSFRYPGTAAPVWSGIDLSVNKGDRLLLAGPSGSGKSTLLGIMTGLVPRLTSGRVEGTIERSYASYGLVMQNPYAQLVAPTVYEELAFGLENRSLPVSETRDRVDAMLSAMGISALKDRICATLSGGEAQKLSLACALIGEPELLFLDEPTAYLDPWSAEEFFKLLSGLARGRGMVVVEHRVGEAAAIVDKVFLLDGEGSGRSQDDVAAAVESLRFKASAPVPALGTPAAATSPAGGAKTDDNRGLGAEMPPVLEIEAMSHRYATDSTTQTRAARRNSDGVPTPPKVLESVDMILESGSVTVVMGPSGSGKSTLLKKIAAWLPSGNDTRKLDFGGRDWLREKPRKRAGDIVFIPQNPEHFFLCMTVREELAYTGRPDSEIREVAERFRLQTDSMQHPASLSEGEKRRLNLACAFLDARPLVLMDEPSYGLDLSSTCELVDGIRALRGQGRIVLIVTHSPELAESVADRRYLMKDGKLDPVETWGSS